MVLRPTGAQCMTSTLFLLIVYREATPVAEVENVPKEAMDINTAVKMVLKKAISHDGLARGLHEAARAIEKGQVSSTLLLLQVAGSWACSWLSDMATLILDRLSCASWLRTATSPTTRS